MEFILDFQGFKIEKNEFVIKELSIISTDGQFYELHLFQPPCEFDELSENVKKQIVWLEKHYHGLYWASGLKEYSELKDIIKGMNISGKVYVKGVEKQKFISETLADLPSATTVINLEDLGCPKLSVLRKELQPTFLKSCSFNHNSNNCAFVNCHAILQWWKQEQFAKCKLELVDLAIKECYSKGYINLASYLIPFLPKHFILNYSEDIDLIYEKLPKHLQTDEELQQNRRCNEHYYWKGVSSGFQDWDGPNPKKKHCYYCKSTIVDA